VEAIPVKRTAPPQTYYLEHDEIETLFKNLPRQGALALRDWALFMVLYNTGALTQEVADLRVENVDLDGPLRVRLWRSSTRRVMSKPRWTLKPVNQPAQTCRCLALREKGPEEIIVVAVSSREQSPGCQARKGQVLHSCAMEIRAEEPLQLLTPLY
jgi:site-specific recombinase XerD